MALENHILLKKKKGSFHLQDRPVGFNVTEVPCTQHPLIDVASVHIAADLQETVLVVDF